MQDHAALYGVTESYASSGKKSNKRSTITKHVRAGTTCRNVSKRFLAYETCIESIQEQEQEEEEEEVKRFKQLIIVVLVVVVVKVS